MVVFIFYLKAIIRYQMAIISISNRDCGRNPAEAEKTVAASEFLASEIWKQRLQKCATFSSAFCNFWRLSRIDRDFYPNIYGIPSLLITLMTHAIVRGHLVPCKDSRHGYRSSMGEIKLNDLALDHMQRPLSGRGNATLLIFWKGAWDSSVYPRTLLPECFRRWLSWCELERPLLHSEQWVFGFKNCRNKFWFDLVYSMVKVSGTCTHKLITCSLK